MGTHLDQWEAAKGKTCFLCGNESFQVFNWHGHDTCNRCNNGLEVEREEVTDRLFKEAGYVPALAEDGHCGISRRYAHYLVRLRNRIQCPGCYIANARARHYKAHLAEMRGRARMVARPEGRFLIT